jgi:AcrR family transcriptional regulator
VNDVRRVDAARNRKRVLEAAVLEHEVHGTALGMQDVARRAGVGIGTVYRHFASRQALIEAIAHPFHERSLEAARAVVADVPAPDRFATYVRSFARTLAEHGVFGQSLWDGPAAEPVRAELRELVAGFVESARAAGTLRPEIAAEDGFTLLWTTAALVEAADEPIWQRYVEVALAGLGGASGQSAVPPVDRAQWDAFVRAPRPQDSR